MTKRVLIAVGLVAAVASGSAIALAQPQIVPGMRGPGPGRPGPGGRGGGPLDFGLRGIELSDTQREQIRSIMESHRGEFDTTGTKLREAHRAFAQAVEAASVDESAIRAASGGVAAAMADEAILRAKVRADVHATLTPEQLEQLKQRRDELEKRRGDMQPPGPRRRGQR
jgi:protein CpxP